MDSLDKSSVVYQIVLTKTDKPSKDELEKVIADTKEKIKKHPAAFPEIMLTSADRGFGIEELREEILKLV